MINSNNNILTAIMGECKLVFTICLIASSKEKKDVAFNRLPALVKQWDQTQQDNINKF